MPQDKHEVLDVKVEDKHEVTDVIDIELSN